MRKILNRACSVRITPLMLNRPPLPKSAEDVLRALVQQNEVRGCVVAKVDGGPAWGLSIRLGGNRRALGAGTLQAREDPHLGEFDRRGSLRGRDRVAGMCG